MAFNTAIPTPPRPTGNHAEDLTAIFGYLSDLHTAAVIESGLLDPAHQATPAPFNPASLPSPANSSIATAQDTANRAYQKATGIAHGVFGGGGAGGGASAGETLTLTDPDTTVSFTFGNPLPDTNYPLLIEPISYSGPSSPPIAAFVPTAISKQTTGFTVTFGSAPGAGNSITFRLVINF